MGALAIGKLDPKQMFEVLSEALGHEPEFTETLRGPTHAQRLQEIADWIQAEIRDAARDAGRTRIHEETLNRARDACQEVRHDEPRILAGINEERKAAGLPPLCPADMRGWMLDEDRGDQSGACFEEDLQEMR